MRRPLVVSFTVSSGQCVLLAGMETAFGSVSGFNVSVLSLEQSSVSGDELETLNMVYQH